MNGRVRLADSLAHMLHSYLIWWLLGAYALAAIFPAAGLWFRDASLGLPTSNHSIAVFWHPTKIPLLAVMLAVLLFNAGLGIQMSQLKTVLARKRILTAGVIANTLIPVAFIFALTQVLRFWYELDEAQHILLGLALVASMPIAGSSTAWAQNANGNLALSLGLVLFSTVLSPLVTPTILHMVGWMTIGEYATALHDLAAYGTQAFLGTWVVIPSLLGLLVRLALGEVTIRSARPYLKLVNSIDLLLLNYSNTSVSLPQIAANPDFDFLALILGAALGMCCTAFAVAYWLGELLKLERAESASLMYGLGMNNNGTGLVFATLALGGYPQAMLPIVFYNLVQHLVAGSIHLTLFRNSTPWPVGKENAR